MKKGKQILIPAGVFIGELIPWKGKWWKVQLYDQAGGRLEFQGNLTKGQQQAYTENPVLVLEMQGDTTGELKRRKT